MRMPTLRTVVALLAALAMSLAVAMLYLVPPAQPEQKVRDSVLSLDTWTVEWRDEIIPVYTQGQVSARHELPLSLEVSGRIEEVAPVFADGPDCH